MGEAQAIPGNQPLGQDRLEMGQHFQGVQIPPLRALEPLELECCLEYGGSALEFNDRSSSKSTFFMPRAG